MSLQKLSIIGLRLLDARDEINLAMRSDEYRDTRLAMARNYMASALMAGAEDRTTEAEEWLVDFIATAITDSTDIDCTSESQARYIVDELFKHLKPEDA